jgi:hypothetical protein
MSRQESLQELVKYVEQLLLRYDFMGSYLLWQGGGGVLSDPDSQGDSGLVLGRLTDDFLAAFQKGWRIVEIVTLAVHLFW